MTAESVVTGGGECDRACQDDESARRPEAEARVLLPPALAIDCGQAAGGWMNAGSRSRGVDGCLRLVGQGALGGSSPRGCFSVRIRSARLGAHSVPSKSWCQTEGGRTPASPGSIQAGLAGEERLTEMFISASLRARTERRQYQTRLDTGISTSVRQYVSSAPSRPDESEQRRPGARPTARQTSACQPAGRELGENQTTELAA